MDHSKKEAFEEVKNIILTAKEKAYSETDFAPEAALDEEDQVAGGLCCRSRPRRCNRV